MENTKKKILVVVEDDLDLQNAVLDRFRSERDFQVFKASDGEEAISIILDQKPELILLDLLLPKLDGFKVLERIRNYPDKSVAGSKVVVLSNLWSDKDILHARSLNIDEYFVKSNTNLEDVIKKIKQLTRAPEVPRPPAFDKLPRV